MITIKIKPESNPQIVTWEHVRATPGVYRVIEYKNARFVTNHVEETFIFDSSGLYVVDPSCWRDSRFIKMDEKIIITFE